MPSSRQLSTTSIEFRASTRNIRVPPIRSNDKSRRCGLTGEHEHEATNIVPTLCITGATTTLDAFLPMWNECLRSLTADVTRSTMSHEPGRVPKFIKHVVLPLISLFLSAHRRPSPFCVRFVRCRSSSLDGNQLAELPAGIFHGLDALHICEL